MREVSVHAVEPKPNVACSIGYEALILSLIMLVGLLLRLACFAGISPNDDEQYDWLAHQMAHGEFRVGEYQGPPVWSLRLGLVIPVAAAFRIAGTTEIAALFFPFLYSMISILIAFFAGRAMLGQSAGLLAGAIQAVIPLDVRMASWLLPDAMAACWANVGVMLLWYSSNQAVRSTKCGFAACSGLAFGVSWLCKESIFYLFPFVSVFLLWLVIRTKGNLIVLVASAGAFFAIFLSEAIFYYLDQNDFLFRLHETERNYEMTKSWFFTEGSELGWKPGGYWVALVRRLFLDGPRSILFNENFGLATTIAVLAVPYMVICKLPNHRFLVTWFLSLVVMFNFGSSSLKVYQPIVLFDRYLYPVLLPAILLTSGFVAFLFSRNQSPELRRERIFWGTVLSAGILAASCLGIVRYAKEGINSSVQRSIASIVGPQDTIYSDSQTPSVVKFLWGYPKTTQFCDFRGLQTAQVPHGVYVLIDRKQASFVSAHYGDALPEFFNRVPDSWSVRWSAHGAALYFVNGASSDKRGLSSEKCVNGL